MGVFHSLAGQLHIRLTCADISGLLSRLSERDIPLYQVSSAGDLSVQGTIDRKDYRTVCELTERCGGRLEILKRRGMYWSGKALLRRPVLLIGITVFMLLAMYLPTRIYFVRVEGNSSVPTMLILEAAEDCGIGFGASRREVRSEKVKNALVEQIPELQWVGVNTSGCVATIRVSEKTVVSQSNDSQTVVSSIIAARDGVIREYTVTRGNALCQVGQAVKAGQTLVSGYTDCGIAIKATRAEAEVYAQTLWDLVVVTPTTASKRGVETGRETKYSLLIGKKLLKLFKDSGISSTDCVKMYEESSLTLPGGFQLPIGIVSETWIYYDTRAAELTQAESHLWLQQAADVYLKSQMVAGTILDQDAVIELESGICRLSGKYACLEMIGQEKSEEILQK